MRILYPLRPERCTRTRLVAAAGTLVVTALFASGTTFAGTDSPESLINDLHKSLADVMANAKTLGYKGRYAKLEPALNASFDLDFMGAKALGRYWKDLSTDQQRQWLAAFRRFTIANYAARFNDYSGETFKIVGQEDAGHETVVVRTEIFAPERDDDMTRLNYRMRETADGWRVIDVYLNGSVSELALRRAEFSTAFGRDGFEKILATVESKIADLSSGSGA